MEPTTTASAPSPPPWGAPPPLPGGLAPPPPPGSVSSVTFAEQVGTAASKASDTGSIKDSASDAGSTATDYTSMSQGTLVSGASTAFYPPQVHFFSLDDFAGHEIGAILDPLGNAVHTVMEAGVSAKSVLISGVGIIGLMAVTVAKAAGAARIFCRSGSGTASTEAVRTWVRVARRRPLDGPQVLARIPFARPGFGGGVLQRLGDSSQCRLPSLPFDHALPPVAVDGTNDHGDGCQA